MKNNLSRRRIMVIVLPCAAWSFLGASVEVAAAQVMAIEEAMEPNGDVQTLDLTSDQKITIYREAREKKEQSGANLVYRAGGGGSATDDSALSVAGYHSAQRSDH